MRKIKPQTTRQIYRRLKLKWWPLYMKDKVIRNVMDMDGQGKGNHIFVSMSRLTGRTTYLICKTISVWTHDPSQDIHVAAFRKKEADHIRSRLVVALMDLKLPIPKITISSNPIRSQHGVLPLVDHTVP